MNGYSFFLFYKNGSGYVGLKESREQNFFDYQQIFSFDLPKD